MAEACLRVPVFATPPSEQVPAQRREVPTPVRATAPIVGFVFIGAVGKNISDFPDCSERD